MTTAPDSATVAPQDGAATAQQADPGGYPHPPSPRVPANAADPATPSRAAGTSSGTDATGDAGADDARPDSGSADPDA